MMPVNLILLYTDMHIIYLKGNASQDTELGVLLFRNCLENNNFLNNTWNKKFYILLLMYITIHRIRKLQCNQLCSFWQLLAKECNARQRCLSTWLNTYLHTDCTQACWNCWDLISPFLYIYSKKYGSITWTTVYHTKCQDFGPGPVDYIWQFLFNLSSVFAQQMSLVEWRVSK